MEEGEGEKIKRNEERRSEQVGQQKTLIAWLE
jgi:hypothetical protein